MATVYVNILELGTSTFMSVNGLVVVMNVADEHGSLMKTLKLDEIV